MKQQQKLAKEMLAYADYTKQQVRQMSFAIEKSIAQLKSTVRICFPQQQPQIETFGSFATGIWLPTSDVDLVILGLTKDEESCLPFLRILAAQLQTEQYVVSVTAVETAKIPVIKIICTDSKVPIDITFESSKTHSGLLARDLVKEYVEQIPDLYPLAIILKQLLREHGLNDAYTGGLSSYSTVLMTIHFLQLWRAGEEAFATASIYASGCIPPEVQTKKNSKNREEKKNSEKKKKVKNQSEELTNKKNDIINISYAAAANYGKKQQQSDVIIPSVKNETQQDNNRVPSSKPFSYADAITSKKEAKKKVVSYASALLCPEVQRKSCPSNAAVKTKTEVMKKPEIDSVSISSSADTEDSSTDNDHESDSLEDEESTSSNNRKESSVGECMIHLLEFFGTVFNYRSSGISVRKGGFIFRTSNTSLPKDMLVIEDPFLPTNNVAASTFAIEKVVKLFEDSFYTLKYFHKSRFSPTILSSLLSTSGYIDKCNSDGS